MKNRSVRLMAGVLGGVIVLGDAGVSVSAAVPTAGVTDYTSTVITTGTIPSAGFSMTMTDVVKKAESDQILASAQPKVQENETPKVKSEYADMAVAQVEDFVYIRKKASEDSEYVGKLYTDCVGTVLKKKGNWYKIQSGNVTGYVSADYVKVGDEKLAKSVGTRLATVETETLKVREDTSKKSEVLGLVSGEDELLVIDESSKGWVGISTEEGTGYVSSKYVNITTEYQYAESKEEEAERLQKEEEERQEALAAAEEAEALEEQTAESADDTSAESETVKTTTKKTTATKKSSTSSTKSESRKSSSNENAGASISSRNEGETSDSNSDEDGEDSSIYGNDEDSSSDDTTVEEADDSSESNEDEEVADSSKGQSVADYACQFIGNPYVWGGTSLTNGADCSGFVMSVYAHFGISLPHSSSALRSVGRSVSKSNMKPGDIVCYSGHVGIYIGGNTIVHASNRRDGIKTTSPANYRTILAVRRIL